MVLYRYRQLNTGGGAKGNFPMEIVELRLLPGKLGDVPPNIENAKKFLLFFEES